MQSDRRAWFGNICSENGLLCSDYQLEQLECYVKLLLEWNRKINLISRKDEENIWNYHILHSISPLFKINIMKNSKIIDIGTGGGLPGIPIKIMNPDISIICIDSTRKKINAVLKMINELKLEGIKVAWGRAEEVGLQSEYFEKFDIVIARAVAPLNELVSWAKNFLKRRTSIEPTKNTNAYGRIDLKDPTLLAFKGGDLSKEIKITKRKLPHININMIDLTFVGSEQLIDSDKKILVIQF